MDSDRPNKKLKIHNPVGICQESSLEDMRRQALIEMRLAQQSTSSHNFGNQLHNNSHLEHANNHSPQQTLPIESNVKHAASQTDEWRTLTCSNCEEIFYEDDDSVLCSNCSFWNHFKCIKRKVYDGDKVEGADECIFCYALKSRKERCEISMNDQVNMVEVAEDSNEDSDSDSPRGNADTWKYYWNIIRPYDGRNIKAGDYVYIPDTEKQVVVIWFVDYLFRDGTGRSFANVSELCFPENIMRFQTQKFFPNEVYLMTGEGVSHSVPSYTRLDLIKGPTIAVLSLCEYRKYIPRCVPRAHIYIERHFYDRSNKNPNKYTTRTVRACDHKTCLEHFAVKPQEPSFKPDRHKEKKYEEIDWMKIRIQPRELT